MITTNVKNNILNNWFRGTGATLPTTLYVGLSKTAPTEAGGNVTEPTASSYKRIAIQANTTNWTTASNGKISNAVVFRFPEATEAWTTSSAKITHFAIYDAQTGGNLLFYGQLSISQEIPIGSIMEIPIGGLSTQLTNVS